MPRDRLVSLHVAPGTATGRSDSAGGRSSLRIYVDPLLGYGKSATWKYTHSCHMFADDVELLHQFAASIGLRREWFQCKRGRDGRVFPHYDLNGNKRKLAVARGAVELDLRQARDKWIELGFITPKLAE